MIMFNLPNVNLLPDLQLFSEPASNNKISLGGIRDITIMFEVRSKDN